MNRPMPSPRGTNHERAFLPAGSRVVAAYDAAILDDTTASVIVDFLTDKLDDDDLAKVKEMLGVEDDDKPASGASDKARLAIVKPRYTQDAFPHRGRLK